MCMYFLVNKQSLNSVLIHVCVCRTPQNYILIYYHAASFSLSHTLVSVMMILRSWWYFALVLGWVYTATLASGMMTSSCLTLQPGITNKTCEHHVDFTANEVRSRLHCADMCRDQCAGVFYSSTTRQCIGCRGLYSSSTGPGVLQDSVYYMRKWRTEYVGCFRDCQNMDPCPRRVMQYKSFSYFMTIDMCLNLCMSSGLKYFATQNGMGCYCGDDTYDMDGPANNCNEACAGNSSQICGGYSANSVYAFVFEC